jgi:hypothetical protein
MKKTVLAAALFSLTSLASLPAFACNMDLAASHGGHARHAQDSKHGGGHGGGHGDQSDHAGHAGHAAHSQKDADSAETLAAKKRCNPAVKAFEEANTKMHSDMAITYSGDADLDFVRGMIPHHQGAVDMAQVVMQYGRDPQVRRLAMEIIRGQNREIAWMKKYAEQIEKRGIQPVATGAKPRAGFDDITWAGHTWMGER